MMPPPTNADFAIDPAAAPPAEMLPRSLLYATSARFGGSGLDVTALEGARAAWRRGCLGRVIAFANQQHEIPRRLVHSLAANPVRMLSWFLDSAHYYGAKKRCADRAAERALRSGAWDAFHGWSGDCLRTLIAARQRRIPSVIDIPTWHRNKGREKAFFTKKEREREKLSGWERWKERLLPSRQHILLEYELATLLLMPSLAAAESFRSAGVAEAKLHYVGRGVDPARYTAGPPPAHFRLAFVGALIERKGVHHLLRVWKSLALKNAELLLVGEPHPEIQPALRECQGAGMHVTVTGFVRNVQDHLRSASAFVFPSELEGFAKATLEAAACALPIIATQESGDAVVHGVTGAIIPPNNPDALAAAIRDFHDNPGKLPALGAAGRQRVLDFFTWDHYRARLLRGYARALAMVRGLPGDGS
jgi:glycosyltransferase involved in cell wall biosynthesis